MKVSGSSFCIVFVQLIAEKVKNKLAGFFLFFRAELVFPLRVFFDVVKELRESGPEDAVRGRFFRIGNRCAIWYPGRFPSFMIPPSYF